METKKAKAARVAKVAAIESSARDYKRRGWAVHYWRAVAQIRILEGSTATLEQYGRRSGGIGYRLVIDTDALRSREL